MKDYEVKELCHFGCLFYKNDKGEYIPCGDCRLPESTLCYHKQKKEPDTQEFNYWYCGGLY